MPVQEPREAALTELEAESFVHIDGWFVRCSDIKEHLMVACLSQTQG
eukprot:CAMPEP_0197864382 /NCGR_PEP_ID=MMETSP1438-20131217/42583_1 /TAXON_ID=1461541 /ORGANISM="Pterosperma sp., Strain CCMP1384" /LENGTH=46 /DNA_ID= /DNA_START= /DNA_END= /DNA_ORIENTATION=